MLKAYLNKEYGYNIYAKKDSIKDTAKDSKIESKPHCKMIKIKVLNTKMYDI